MPHHVPNIELRPLRLPDADVIAGWAGDLEFCRAADWSTTKTPAQHVQFHRDLIAHPPAALLRLGAIESGDLIGYVDLHGEERGRREIGFVVGGRENWGRSLGRAAATAGLRFGFEQLHLHEIWAEAVAANVGSIRILQHIGMCETGDGAEATYLGARSRFRQFEITRQAWDHL